MADEDNDSGAVGHRRGVCNDSNRSSDFGANSASRGEAQAGSQKKVFIRPTIFTSITLLGQFYAHHGRGVMAADAI